MPLAPDAAHLLTPQPDGTLDQIRREWILVLEAAPRKRRGLRVRAYDGGGVHEFQREIAIRRSTELLALYGGARLMQAGTAMFVIELTYTASLAEIDASMAAHVMFLKKYYAAGNFLVSGRKIPRDGGIIVAVGKSREHIDVIIREDPFYERGLADFRIIEFRASQRAADIDKRIGR